MQKSAELWRLGLQELIFLQFSQSFLSFWTPWNEFGCPFYSQGGQEAKLLIAQSVFSQNRKDVVKGGLIRGYTNFKLINLINYQVTNLTDLCLLQQRYMLQ